MPDQSFTTLYPQAGDPELLLLAKIAAGINGRTAPEDVLIFDGITSASRAYWTLPSTPSLASSPLTVHALVGNDATSAAVVRGIWALSSLSTAYAATALALYRSSNDLVLELTGAAAGTDYRRITFSNWFTNTAAGVVPVTVSWSRNSAPTLYVRGVAVTTGTETTGGTAPAWTASIVATYLVGGVRAAAERWNNRLKLALWNDNLSAAEVLALATGPLAPSWSGDSNAVLRYTSDFSAGVDSWSLSATAAGATLTGNIDSIASRDNTLRIVDGTGSGVYAGATRSLFTIGRRYRISGSYYVPAANSTLTGFTAWGQNTGTIYIAATTTTGAWTAFSVEFTADDATLALYATGAGGHLHTGTGSDLVYLEGWTVTELGPVFRPVVQPCRIVDDSGPNVCSGVLTSGVLPVTDKMDFRIAGSVASNAVALVQLFAAPVFIDPTRVSLDTIEIKPNGTPTLSIGDGTTATKYTASAAKTAVWIRETISANYPADAAKTGVHVNVTVTGGTTCLVVIRGHRAA
jgi:hypothetical protein